MIDWSLTRGTPFAHQIADTETLLEKPAFALFLEMGLGKSRIVTDAACALHQAGEIDTLLVVCPASARSVWADPDPILGEFVKWVWEGVDYRVQEYHSRTPKLPRHTGLQAVVTNPEFLRRKERLEPLIQWAESRKVFLVLDESWAYQNHRAQQTKAALALRQACRRVVLLNGTPGSPDQLFSQFRILSKDVFDGRNYWNWRARYCKLGGYLGKAIVGYENLDEFQAKTAPYAVYRKTRDCLDLPPKSHTQIEARLTPATWALYKSMRDDLVAWLSEHEVATAAQAGVRVLRLAQLTAGFLGGVESESIEPDLYVEGTMPMLPPSGTREVGREKLDALLEWLEQWEAGAPDPRKLIVWGRFRAEIERTAEALASRLQSVRASVQVRKLYGGQHAVEREEIKRLLAPGGEPTASYIVGSPAAGGAGLNLAAANVAIYLTNSFSLKDRLQSEGRIDRPGQTRPVLYVDILATGPNGEKTLDHHIAAALRKKHDLASWTADVWRKVLTEE